MSRVSKTVDVLYDEFDNISTKDEFERKVRLTWKKFGDSELSLNRMRNICFGLWVKIYSINLSNTKEVNAAEGRFSKLNKVTSRDDFYIPWNKTKYSTLANLVLDIKHRKFKLKIMNTEQLEILIFSWRAVGVRVEPQNLVKFLTDKIKRENLARDKKLIERCADILGDYTEYDNSFKEFYEHSKKLWVKKLSKSEIKEEIIKRSNRERTTVNGKYLRDHELALLLKKYHKAVCVVCGSKKNIEVSHKIPLSLGEQNYAFDLPFNMDLCCHPCHKRHERNFDEKYEKSTDKKNFVKEIHESDVRNSPWTKYIDSEHYKVSEKPEYSGVMKCVKCLKRYRKISFCKSCDGELLPIEDAFFKVIRS